MSTKIHNGYMVTPPDMWKLPNTLREIFIPIRDSLHVVAAVRSATALLDRGTGIHDPLTSAHHKIMAAALEARRSEERHPETDFTLDITFLSDPSTGLTHAMLYAENDAHRTAWTALEWVTPYSHWNNTNRPDHLSESEWDNRRVAWDRMIGWNTPKEVGLSWGLEPPAHHIHRLIEVDPQAASGAIPSLQERSRFLAEANLPDIPEELLAVPQADRNGSWLWKVADWAKGWIEENAHRFEGRLNPIDLHDLGHRT